MNLTIVSSTRADWGLLMPLAVELRKHAEVSVVATNMHLVPELGMTVDEIIAAGFDPVCVPCALPGDDDLSRAHVMARCLAGVADAFAALDPDIVVLLGDRYEMLAIAEAAAMLHIPIVHIAGGEVSEGALDDAFRHAITKLSSLHLTATEEYRRRVIQLGEQPDTVVNTGAIGVWNAFNIAIPSAEELGADLGVDFSNPVAAVTFHPATNDASQTPGEQLQALLDALDVFDELTCVITAPNNDAGGRAIFEKLKEYASARPEKVRLVSSLGMRRYQALLRYAAVVVGNSSSGIVEAPSAGTPTVDIGMRQQGRIAARSVIHCGTSKDEINKAIREALSPEMQLLASKKENPYYMSDTLRIMVRSILDFAATLPREPKHFYDL